METEVVPSDLDHPGRHQLGTRSLRIRPVGFDEDAVATYRDDAIRARDAEGVDHLAGLHGTLDTLE